jgi:hypothetical protein
MLATRWDPNVFSNSKFKKLEIEIMIEYFQESLFIFEGNFCGKQFTGFG